MNPARIAALGVLVILLGSGLLGCARRPAPTDLQALPHPGGKIRLTWSAAPGGAEGVDSIVVERRAPGEPWRVIAEADAQAVPPFVDDAWDGVWDDAWDRGGGDDAGGAGAVRRPFSYRVATRSGGRLSEWSNLSTSVPTFVGKPFSGWLNVADYDDACSVPGVDDPQPIQCALHDLGGRTDDHTTADGPHVLFIPDGVYDVRRTLFVEGRGGIQVVGESPGGVVLRWTGRRGATPDDAAVLFHAEGNRDATFRNLVWDGNCEDPDDCFVIAFDQSFCGRPSGKILRSNACGAALDWPESPDIGVTDNGGAHFDSVFKNAYVGLRLGHHGVADDTATLRRCRFEDNFVGVSLEDFNALHHWFWDPTFQRNYVGITNDLADVRRAFDPYYRPGRCVDQAGEPGCFDGGDCAPGMRCERPSHWGGDFAVGRGRFIDNRDTDVWAQPTGEFIVRDSASTGARRFLYGAGPNASRGSYSLIGNTVWGGDQPTVVTRGPGTFLLLDNTFHTRGDGPAVRSDALVGLDPRIQESGAVDLVAIGNEYSTAEPYAFGSRHRLRESGRRAAPAVVPPVVVPPPPAVRDPLNSGPVYTVTGAYTEDGVANARRIQQIIDAALADPQPAIVHFPGVGGRIPIAETLRIPAGAELTLVGDGAFTTLWWIGPPGMAALEIDADGTAGVTVRDLQFLRAGVVVKHLERQPGRVFASQLRLDENAVAGLVAQELDRVGVDLIDYKSSFGVLGGEGVVGTVVDVGRGGDDAAGDSGAIAIWSGDTGRNQTDYLVLNDTAGARLLVTGNYMEKSYQHLRIQGNGAGGQVTFLGGKFAPIVLLENPDAPEALAQATATVPLEDYAGRLGLWQSQMFVVAPQQSGNSHPGAVDHGARVRVVGSKPLDLDVVGLGLALRRQPSARAPDDPLLDDPEYDFSLAGPNRVRYLRLAGKRSARHALPLPDIDVAAGAVSAVGPALKPSAEERLLASLQLVRALDPPGFYDEVAPGGPPPRIRLDKVFVFKAQAAIVLSAGVPCSGAADCEGDPATRGFACDRTGIPEALPGRCRPAPGGAAR